MTHAVRAGREVAAAAPAQVQEPAPSEGRPWSQGFTPAPGAGSGRGATLRHESYTVAIDDKDDLKSSIDGDVDFTVDGFQYAFALGQGQLRLQLAAVRCSSEGAGPDSDAGVLGGAAYALPIMDVGRFVWGGDLGVQGGRVGWNQLLYGDTSVGWLQYDLRTGLAYAPSPTSRAALSPRLGVGVRAIDGVQDLGDGGTTDFDVVAPYALAGFGAHVRTSARSRLVLDLHGLVGAVQGVEFAFSFQF